MNSFSFNDAVGFKLATQQEDKNARVQVFIGVFSASSCAGSTASQWM
jgi:hypothetical protein